MSWEKRRDESFQAWAEKPLGTDSHWTISKQLRECWFLIGYKKCLVLLIASKRFPKSLVVLSFLVSKVENESFPCMHNVGEQTGHQCNIVWQDNSCLIQTHEKNSGNAVCQLGTIIQSIFLCPIRSQHSLDHLEIVR